jgi:hypothetical protein
MKMTSSMMSVRALRFQRAVNPFARPRKTFAALPPARSGPRRPSRIPDKKREMSARSTFQIGAEKTISARTDDGCSFARGRDADTNTRHVARADREPGPLWSLLHFDRSRRSGNLRKTNHALCRYAMYAQHSINYKPQRSHWKCARFASFGVS